MKVLAILAHPDDEIIFGWPIFQHKHIQKHLICATGNKARLKALDQVSKILNFTWECLGLPDPGVNDHLDRVQESIKKACHTFSPTVIFTHNPHGEYNHPDHLALFSCVFKSCDTRNLLVTDMSISLKGSGFPATPLKIKGKELKHYKNALCRQNRDAKLYNKVQKIYQKHKSWVWGKRKIDEAGLYFVKQSQVHRKYTLDTLSSLLCNSSSCSVAEIGVFKGITTKYLALCDHIDTVYAVDPWKYTKGYTDHKKLLGNVRRKDSHGASIPANTWDQLFKHVHKDLSKFPKINIVRETSEDASVIVPNELDMIFIDGDHTYKAVMQDLELWIPKIKPGGIISGHDFTWTQDNYDKQGLVKAVMKYFKVHHEDFYPVVDSKRNHLINRQDDRVWWQRKK